MSQEIIFVYNAKSGVWNGILDSLHKLSSPQSYQCELCQLTYGLTSMNSEWKSFVVNSPYKVTFLHLDEIWSDLPIVDFPAVFLKRIEGYDLLISKDEMKNCKDVKDLIILTKSKLADCGSS
ncbi:MAG: GTPase [Bacillota bacterium]